MAEPRHLKKAPIREALIDVRVRLPEGFDAQVFLGAKSDLVGRYPDVQERSETDTWVKLGPDRPEIGGGQTRTKGFFFKSGDGLTIAQFRIDGFTFNRLKPYTSWPQIFREAREAWDLYRKTTGPEPITRVAVRYINDLVIPAPLTGVSSYLATPLPFPRDYPGKVAKFFTTIVLQDEDRQVSANVSQTFAQGLNEKRSKVVLDIDAYRQEAFEDDNAEAWKTFEALHAAKNEIFFGSITEEMVRLLE
jgi:uncharacterized protein (TIGR04255 family)